jgi:hypothetical protein
MMDDIKEKNSNSAKEQQIKPRIYEEEIFLGHYEGDPEEDLFKYILSNNPDEIEKAINCKIINNFPRLSEVTWEINTAGLAQKIKDLMNKWDVNYSMTIFSDRKDKTMRHVAINWNTDDKWLFYGGVIISNKFFSYEEVGAY